MDGQTDGQADRWTGRQMDRQTDGHTDTKTDKNIDRHTNGHVYRWTDVCRQTDRSMNKLSERQVHSQVVRRKRERQTN